jgi:RimJ/RimL family protein N-acetyltransferase
MEIKLRPINESDISFIHSLRNNKDIVDNLGTNFRFISEAVDRRWIQDQPSNNLRLVIEKEIPYSSPISLGLIYLLHIDHLNQHAEFAIQIALNHQGKGVAAKASSMLINHAFNDLNLNKLYLSVLPYNTRAIRLYEKLGFTQTGIKKDHLYKNGRYFNLIDMELLKCNFIATQ